jgi:hypothetical protein
VRELVPLEGSGHGVHPADWKTTADAILTTRQRVGLPSARSG